jgi:hypothetical protein
MVGGKHGISTCCGYDGIAQSGESCPPTGPNPLQLGLSSIVELSQAQFQQTDAAISNTNTQYQYRLALATLDYEIGATP